MKYAFCIDASDHEASLLPNRLYPILSDREALKDGLIRVVDESGEDYLFSKNRFLIINSKWKLTDPAIAKKLIDKGRLELCQRSTSTKS